VRYLHQDLTLLDFLLYIVHCTRAGQHLANMQAACGNLAGPFILGERLSMVANFEGCQLPLTGWDPIKCVHSFKVMTRPGNVCLSPTEYC